MELSSRLKKLEKTVRERPPAPCAECGAPTGWVPTLRLVNYDGADLRPTCTLCKFPLMSNGRAVSALPPGSVQRRVILHELPAGM